MAELTLQQKSKSDILNELNEREPADEIKEQVREQAHSENVPGVSNGSVITKYQLCGKYCNGCPHGPYAWIVQPDAQGKDDWTYIGKVEGVNGLAYYYERDEDGNPEDVVLVGNSQTSTLGRDDQEEIQQIRSELDEVESKLDEYMFEDVVLSDDAKDFLAEYVSVAGVLDQIEYMENDDDYTERDIRQRFQDSKLRAIRAVNDPQFRNLVKQYSESDYKKTLTFPELALAARQGASDVSEALEELEGQSSYHDYINKRRLAELGVMSDEDIEQYLNSSVETFKEGGSDRYAKNSTAKMLNAELVEGDRLTVSNRYKNGGHEFTVVEDTGTRIILEDEDGKVWEFKNVNSSSRVAHLESIEGDELNPTGLEIESAKIPEYSEKDTLNPQIPDTGTGIDRWLDEITPERSEQEADFPEYEPEETEPQNVVETGGNQMTREVDRPDQFPEDEEELTRQDMLEQQQESDEDEEDGLDLEFNDGEPQNLYSEDE